MYSASPSTPACIHVHVCMPACTHMFGTLRLQWPIDRAAAIRCSIAVLCKSNLPICVHVHAHTDACTCVVLCVHSCMRPCVCAHHAAIARATRPTLIWPAASCTRIAISRSSCCCTYLCMHSVRSGPVRSGPVRFGSVRFGSVRLLMRVWVHELVPATEDSALLGCTPVQYGTRQPLSPDLQARVRACTCMHMCACARTYLLACRSVP